jgi:type IV secretion system protein VirB10
MRDENNANEDGAVDRGIPDVGVGNNRHSGASHKIVFVGICIVVVLLLIAVNGGFKKDSEAVEEMKNTSTSLVNRLGDPPPIPQGETLKTEPQKEEPAERKVIKTGNRGAAVEDEGITPEERKMQGSVLGEVKGKRSGINTLAGATSDGDISKSGLGSKLTPSKIGGTSATLMQDRSFFVTRGSFIDCALETAISSDQAGMTSCRITNDIYSTDGKVLLVERGSRATGQYKGGLENGRARIFVLWERVETPNGVLIDINSPGTDALGRSGHAGYVDTHFFDRFGNAILLSLIDDFSTAWSSKVNDGRSSEQMNFNSTSENAQDMAEIALEHSIDIPATLNKNQGDHISIFVARDLDFRGVYEFAIVK